MTIRRGVLSLFSGCGGLDLGFVQAGFHLNMSIDNWKPAVATHLRNHRLLGGEVVQRSLALADNEIRLDELPRSEIILGGPPCQGFSFAGKQFFDDPRNQLYMDFVRVVDALRPRAFLMENVRGMEAMALEDVKAAFKAAGYTVWANRALATDFGVPQRRERLFIVGFRTDLDVEFSPPPAVYGGLFARNTARSILEAIADLPMPMELIDPLATQEDDEVELSAYLRSHAYRPLPETVQRFVRHIPNGGCFRDAPAELLPRRLVAILENPARYRSPRLFPKPDPNEPAQTIPADTNPSLGGVLAPDLIYPNGRSHAVDTSAHTHSGLYTSPLPSRRLTPREAARLQTFPDEYEFSGSLTTQFALIGNAVAVSVARAYAEHILGYLLELDRKRKPLVQRA